MARVAQSFEKSYESFYKVYDSTEKAILIPGGQKALPTEPVRASRSSLPYRAHFVCRCWVPPTTLPWAACLSVAQYLWQKKQ